MKRNPIKQTYSTERFNKRIMRRHHRNGFTHFASLPFIRPAQRQKMSLLQKQIMKDMGTKGLDKYLKINSPNLFHLTLSMLTLEEPEIKEWAKELINDRAQDFRKILSNVVLTGGKLGYFTMGNGKGPKGINIIYLDLQEDENYQKVKVAADYLIKLFLKEGIIEEQKLRSMNIVYNQQKQMFGTRKLHLTLFRCSGLHEDEDFLQIYEKICDIFKGEKLQCDSFDISTRFSHDQTKFFRPLCRIPINDQK